MRRAASLALIAASSCATFGLGRAAHADDADDGVAHGLSDTTTPLIGATVVGLSVLGRGGRTAAEESAETLAYTIAATSLLKAVTNVKRPSGNGDDSFPSGHTSAAFALATIIAHEYPKMKYPSYAWAIGVGWSRKDLNAHRMPEVIAGAALGWGMARWTLARRHHHRLGFLDPSPHEVGGLLVSIGPEPAPEGMTLMTVRW